MANAIKVSWRSKLFNLFKNTRLEVGDRVKLCGGYESVPEWLDGKKAYYGEVIGFIPGPYKKMDAIVRLDEEIVLPKAKGKIIILTLRFRGAVWGKTEIVHLYLFDTIPQDCEWSNANNDERDKTHIESHATYRIIRK